MLLYTLILNPTTDQFAHHSSVTTIDEEMLFPEAEIRRHASERGGKRADHCGGTAAAGHRGLRGELFGKGVTALPGQMFLLDVPSFRPKRRSACSIIGMPMSWTAVRIRHWTTRVASSGP